MADLTGKTIANGYPNLVTIGATTNDNPTTGTLENGKGNNLTSVTFDGAVVVNESGGNNDFRVEGDTDANLIFADASADAVGIGTSSPAKELDVDGEIRASGGILFGTDTAAANTLDDYEEGTWTPVYVPSSGSFTTMTMDIVSATYTKIGRQVTVQCWIRTDNVDTTGASGQVRISGLPFTVGNNLRSAISVSSIGGWQTVPTNGISEYGQTYIRLRKSATWIDVADLTTGAVTDQNDLNIIATYFV